MTEGGQRERSSKLHLFLTLVSPLQKKKHIDYGESEILNITIHQSREFIAIGSIYVYMRERATRTISHAVFRMKQ